MEKENYEEIVQEHLEYLKANKANIKLKQISEYFRRDKEWKDSLPFDLQVLKRNFSLIST